MLDLKNTSDYKEQHPEGGDSTKPKFDKLSNTHAEASIEKTRKRTINALSGYEEEGKEGRKNELRVAGLSETQIKDICKSNNRILKLEKHKYWIAIRILMAAKRKKLVSLKKLYNLLIDNKSLEELNKEIKRISISLSKKI